MISKFVTLQFEIKKEVGILTINRPTKLNALNIQVLRELKAALSEITNLPLKGFVLTGEGEKAFIAGADILEMKPMLEGEAHAFSELGQQVTLLFESLPFPSIAAVNGFALGGGFEMALACDFIFATKNAIFGLPETKLGLVPGFGGTQRLARTVGERRAKEMLFSGRNVSSDEAQTIGIALDIFATKSDLMNHVLAWFEMSAQNSSYAISRAKIALQKGYGKEIQEGLEIECEEFGKIFGTPDMIEGTSAFLEKRKAVFKGQI